MTRPRPEPVSRTPRVSTATICLDESGTASTGAKFFAIGGIKLRRPGVLSRSLRDMRDRWGYEGELKFSEITRGSQSLYYDLIDRLEASDAHLVGCVVQGSLHNPFGKGKATWRVHADITSQLLVGCINRRELVGLLMDAVSTPPDCSVEESVRAQVNRRLHATSVVSAVALDSKSNDLLQVADLVAGAMLHERRRMAGQSGNATSPKGKVAARLGLAFGVPGLTDHRGERVNIATFRGRSASSRPRLKVLDPSA